ncbi:MAG: translation initiation factor IF-2 [Puniceicoccales bacterium]|jgi:translation initiation factor IF-2|nr:translation initiation factor IF-2 [Puniceicoccales bacterium]
MSTRIYLLSKKLGMSSKELVTLLRSRGFDVSSASSSVADLSAEDLLREFGAADRKEDLPKKENEEVGEPALEPAAGPAEQKDGLHSRPAERVDRRAIAPRPPVPTTQEEVAMPKLVRQETARPAEQGQRRMVPLDRLQGSNRFSGGRSGPRWNERRDFSGSPERRGGGNFSAGGRFGDGRPPAAGGARQGGRPPNSGAFGRRGDEQRRGDFRAPPRAPERSAHSFAPSPFAAPSRPAADPRSIDAIRQDGKAVRLKFPICVRELAPEIGLKPFQLISELMQMGIFASMNYLVDEALAKRIGERFSLSIEAKQDHTPAGPVQKIQRKQVRSTALESRPPVVCVLGHVDHGKTTLLDRIRQANVAAAEAGGITQHIGAYEVDTPGGRITFIDTPGHAAFSKMRERGANLTDLAVLVVAADDGFMPQTDEALKFARNAGVPVVVAINKMDAKGANVGRVRQQMQQRGIAPEDWGGETLCAEVSALNGDGLPKLLELILVQAEMMALRADWKAAVQGTVLEAQVEVGRGPTASVIVQEGTLKIGDALVCGLQYCKVRALLDDRGRTIKEAPPSKPVKVVGWSGVPESGAVFTFVESEKIAREQAEEARVEEMRGVDEQATLARRRPEGGAADVEALFAAISAKQKRTLRVIIKGDVQGSVEALVACLAALPQDKIGLEILRAAVGPVSPSDVEFARPVGAVLVAFNVRAESGVQAALKQHGISMLHHDIIYMLIDQVREAMADLLDPELQEEKFGAAQVRQVFQLSRGTIAGCMVTEGKVLRDGQARIWRDGKQVFDGKVGSLRREKEDVAEVRAGYECGLSLAGYELYREGDLVECYKVNRIRPSL